MGERVGKMQSHTSRLAACLEQHHDKWAEFICLPSPHLSGISFPFTLLTEILYLFHC